MYIFFFRERPNSSNLDVRLLSSPGKEKSWICLCPFGALDKSVIAQKIACDFLSDLRFFFSRSAVENRKRFSTADEGPFSAVPRKFHEFSGDPRLPSKIACDFRRQTRVLFFRLLRSRKKRTNFPRLRRSREKYQKKDQEEEKIRPFSRTEGKIEDRSENRMRFSERSRICLMPRRGKDKSKIFSSLSPENS